MLRYYDAGQAGIDFSWWIVQYEPTTTVQGISTWTAFCRPLTIFALEMTELFRCGGRVSERERKEVLCVLHNEALYKLMELLSCWTGDFFSSYFAAWSARRYSAVTLHPPCKIRLPIKCIQTKKCKVIGYILWRLFSTTKMMEYCKLKQEHDLVLYFQ